jgi:hypothetical protein
MESEKKYNSCLFRHFEVFEKHSLGQGVGTLPGWLTMMARAQKKTAAAIPEQSTRTAIDRFNVRVSGRDQNGVKSFASFNQDFPLPLRILVDSSVRRR